MKSSVVAAAAYIATHGTPEARGGAANPQITALWAKLLKLDPIKPPVSNGNGGQYLLVEKTDEEDDLKHVRDRVYSGLRGYMRRMSPRTFALRTMLRKGEGHILVWKELLPAAQSPGTAMCAEKPTGQVQLDTAARPKLAPRRDGREKSRPEAKSHPRPLSA